jgi:O-antigen ligase
LFDLEKPEPLLRACIAAAVFLGWLTPFAPGPSPHVLPWLVSLATVAAMLLVAAVHFRIPAQQPQDPLWFIKGAAEGWLAAALVSSCIALVQYLGLSAHFHSWISAAPAGEAYGNLRQRNQFASLTNIGLLAVLWMWQTGTGQRRQRAALLLAAACLLAVGNALSASRTGLLQLLLIAVLCVWWHRVFRAKSPLPVLALAAGAYVLAALGIPWLSGIDGGIFSRLGGGAPACTSRVALWSNVLDLIGQKPWLGWGWGELDYAHYTTLYREQRFCDILDNAHNLPLHLAVELGIPVAILFSGGLAWVVWRLKPWRETDPLRQMAWGVAAVIGTHSMLEYPLWYGPFQIACGFCAAMLWRMKTTGERNAPRRGSRPQAGRTNALPAVAVAAAAMLLAGVMGAGISYHRISQIYLPVEARDAAYRDDTLAKVRESWLFRNQVRFAELSLTPLNRGNAQWTFNTATALLHYSPEPRVIEKLIESAVMLGRDDEAMAHMVRYRAAFPADYARWTQANARLPHQPWQAP